MSARSSPSSSFADAVSRAESWSPYLRGLMRRFPDIAEEQRWRAALVPSIDGDDDTGVALRLAKGQVALATALGDLSGALSLEDVTQGLSDFADRALNAAIANAIVAHVPGAEPRGLAAIALGKHGSRELNYSSDIDPILIFDPQTLPTRPREEPEEAAVRIGRRIVETMQARTEHGYVFRIDLRLRPSPEVTPIVLPVDAAISYYESQALPWERAAFIRARACAGDMALGTSFLDAIRPFVWRRGLDFGAVQEVRDLSRRIRDHYAQGQAFGPGYDLKRGRGGIRECEFYAQIHQLIHGGREPSLRAAATCDALTALAAAGRIGGDEAATLTTAYRLYRRTEHRLQMVDDRQTHSLPTDHGALEGVARLDGLADGKALLGLLHPYVDAVGGIYDALDGDARDSIPETGSALEDAMRDAGFPDPVHAAQRIAHWRSGGVRAVRSPAARAALEAVLPQIVTALGSAQDPQRAILQLSSLIERLPSAVNLFRLLEAQPALLGLLTRILIHAPTLAESLSRRAELLDRLIDASAFDPPGSVGALASEMAIDGDVEQQFDHVRRIVGEHRFALGVQIVEGVCDPLAVAAGYARVAEAAIAVVSDAAIAAFEVSHGTVPGGELVILALGRMGGAELTHASDLDLIFLFTGDFATESDGARPLGGTMYFNRLAQRVIAGLSVATAAGPLYEVDTRLRPSGTQGPLAVSFDAFARYQAEDAWTWEHMALTRARCVYGSDAARAALDRIVATTLATPRDPATLRADSIKMRGDMAGHKPPKSDLDVKLLPGGLVDLEFGVHVTQLANRTGFDPHLGSAIAELSAAGLVPECLVEAHRLMTRLLVVLRLVAPDLATPDPATCALIARACDAPDWPTLLDRLGAVRQEVSDYWAQVSEG
jgi:[glutamine synthetase] adenylyltransferase / [glutamine synthetase]-adenylyl-L-tyrosine phosphorylase